MDNRVAISTLDGIIYTVRDHPTVNRGALIEAQYPDIGRSKIAAMVFPNGGHPGAASADVDPEKPVAFFMGMGGPPPRFQHPQWSRQETLSDKLGDVMHAYHRQVGFYRARWGYFVSLAGSDGTPADYERDAATAATLCDPEIARVLERAGMDDDFDPFDWTSVAHLDYEALAALQAWAEETDDADLQDLITEECRLGTPESRRSGRDRLTAHQEEDALRVIKALDKRWAEGRPSRLVENIRDRASAYAPEPTAPGMC